MMRRLRLLAVLGLLTGAAQASSDAAIGERLYRDGLRADGTPVVAARLQGVTIRGREAACIQCHRASGMGGAEGSTAVPPILGQVLAAPGQFAGVATARRTRLAPGLQQHTPATEQRPAYTPATFARALVHGLGAGGQALDALMPRYHLDDSDLRHLAAYLGTLSIGQAPGHEGRTLHLATIVAADTDAAVQQVTAELLDTCLAERRPPASSDPAAAPTWTLHRWTLGTDPTRWPEELATLQRQQPVFALVSGTTGAHGRGAWQAVQQHCEREAMPCVLPHTASVDDRSPTRWTFHFSRGVSLEASALAEQLGDRPPPGGWRVVHQIVAPDHEAARTGAARLSQWLAASGIASVESPPDAPPPRLDRRDALVLWLPANQLRDYTTHHAPPDPAVPVFVSGELIELDGSAVAAPWRSATHVTSPYDPPDRHLPRLALNAGKWLLGLGLAPAERPDLLRLQAHTYSACEVTANALRRMRHRVGRTYFAELVEGAEEAAVATAYPRFTLGPDQRHGARGLGLLAFDPRRNAQLHPIGEWLTPP